MGYLSVWKVLDEMIADFRKRNVPIPEKVMTDLKSARTTLNVMKNPECRREEFSEIDAYLGSVESYLVSEGEKRLGNKYSEEWLKKLDDAAKKLDEEEKEPRFIPGLPREHKWVRVKPSNELPLKKLETLAQESNLSFKPQKDGYLLVYGTDENVKGFVKKMTTKHGSKLEK